MKARSVETSITDRLARSLESHGFAKENKLLIVRKQGDAENQIRCTARKDRRSGTIWVTLMLGIRFDEVETILNDSEQNDPTLVCQLSSLLEDSSVDEWDAGKEETFDVLLEYFERYAIPFFEKFSTLKGTAYYLEGEKVEDLPFMLHPTTRICVLAGILTITKGKTAAHALLGHEIAKLRDSQNPYDCGTRTRLQKLQTRISELKLNVPADAAPR